MIRPGDYGRMLSDLKNYAEDNGYDWEQLEPESLEKRMQEQGPFELSEESPFEWGSDYNIKVIDENHPDYDLYQKLNRGEISPVEFERLMDERYEKYFEDNE